MNLTFLNPLLEHPGPWASVYVDTSRRTEDAAKRQDLRDRSVVERLTEQGADPDTRRAVRAHLAAEPASRTPEGRALFAAHGEVVLDIPLNSAPAVAETSWSALPHVAPLLTLRGEDPPCLVAHIDSTGADIELRDSRERTPLGQAEGSRWQGRGHRSLPGDRQEWHYRHKVENTWQQTAEIIAGELTRRWPGSGAALLVLTGDARERRAVHDRLPDDLRTVTVEVEGNGRAADGSGGHLDRRIARAREAKVHEHLDAVLDLFRTGRGRPGEHGAKGPDSGPGEAAEGVPAVVDAARSHQVATLLLQEPAGDTRREVWVGPEPDQMAVRRSQAHALGVRDPRPARADDALLRSAIASGAEALLVPEEIPGPAGGVGAVLRWVA